VQGTNLLAKEQNARDQDEHVGEAGQSVSLRQGRDSKNIEPTEGGRGPGSEPQQNADVTKRGEQESEAAQPRQVMSAGLQKNLARCRKRHRTQNQGQRLC